MFKIGQWVWYEGYLYTVTRTFTKPSTSGKLEIYRSINANENRGHILNSADGVKLCKIGTYLYG